MSRSAPLLGRPAIGVDLGGTNVRAGRVQGGHLVETSAAPVPSQGTQVEIVETISDVIEAVVVPGCAGIGVGVPGVVDLERGVVYDVQNLPSWEEVPLKEILEQRFGLPVQVNNDANCFALAERDFGLGRDHSSFIGLVMGTGFAGGIVLDGRLHAGAFCGAGEFGMLPYRDAIFEHYCSGQFFERAYGMRGEEVARRAAEEDREALAALDALGHHLGQALQAIMYAYDTPRFILGGSVSKSFSFFERAMWESLQGFAYGRNIETLIVQPSMLDQPGVLGAATLVGEQTAAPAA